MTTSKIKQIESQIETLLKDRERLLSECNDLWKRIEKCPNASIEIELLDEVSLKQQQLMKVADTILWKYEIIAELYESQKN